MKKIVFLLAAVFLMASYSFSQIKSGPPTSGESKPVTIIWADKLRTEKVDSVREAQTGTGNVQAQQENTLFECDSFYYDKSTKVFEAFGNVHINDNDSINIYSNYLLYHVDTRIANLKKNVRLTDGKSTLTTQQLDYDLNFKIGNYYAGGKVENEKSVLTSTEATYFADRKDVYFKKNVVLIDPQYKLRADSLLYNSESQLTTFITKTYIEDSARNIVTSSGYYDLKNKKAYFGKRPVINDGASQIIADDIDTNDSTGMSLLTGNVFYNDTAQGFAMRGDFMNVNNKTGTLLATRNAVLIIKQDNDSLFVTADTLFSGKLSALVMPPSLQDPAVTDTATILKKETVRKNDALLLRQNDSIRASNPSLSRNIDSLTAKNPSLSRNTDSLTANNSSLSRNTDSLKANNSWLSRNTDSLKANDPLLSRKPDSLQVKDPLLSRNADSIHASDTSKIAWKSVAKADVKTTANANIKPLESKSNPNKPKTITADSTSKSVASKNKPNAKTDSSAAIKGVTVIDTKSTNDSADRYFQAYHRVRIFSDSLQAVGDSLWYSGKDSIFRLFKDPVMWASNSQVSGDTIYIYTKNKKPERVLVFENAIAVNKSGIEMFNQLKGIRITGYFKDGNVDYMRAKGNAESIYYAKDQEDYLVGINRVAGDIIDLRFLNKELNRVVVINEVKGTMYPVTQIPDSEKQLRNFKWQEDRRPKTKFELFEPPKPLPAPTPATARSSNF